MQVESTNAAHLIGRDLAEFNDAAAQNADGRAEAWLIALSHGEWGHERLWKESRDRVFQDQAEMPWGGQADRL
jgi:hypothetical protein